MLIFFRKKDTFHVFGSREPGRQIHTAGWRRYRDRCDGRRSAAGSLFLMT
jgi:hypothetical protein